MQYNIELFNVQENIPSRVFLNPYYKRGNWEAFWELINFKRKQCPDYFIIYNLHKLSDKDKRTYSAINERMNRFNKSENKNCILLSDSCKKQDSEKFNSIFFDTPSQYGLRGDIELWDDLEKYFESLPLPRDENELIRMMKEAIIELTGKSVFDGSNFFVEKYYHGSGMSGGMVCSDFWVHKAFPILIGRYRMATLAL